MKKLLIILALSGCAPLYKDVANAEVAAFQAEAAATQALIAANDVVEPMLTTKEQVTAWQAKRTIIVKALQTLHSGLATIAVLLGANTVTP